MSRDFEAELGAIRTRAQELLSRAPYAHDPDSESWSLGDDFAWGFLVSDLATLQSKTVSRGEKKRVTQLFCEWVERLRWNSYVPSSLDHALYDVASRIAAGADPDAAFFRMWKSDERDKGGRRPSTHRDLMIAAYVHRRCRMEEPGIQKGVAYDEIASVIGTNKSREVTHRKVRKIIKPLEKKIADAHTLVQRGFNQERGDLPEDTLDHLRMVLEADLDDIRRAHDPSTGQR